MLGLRQTVAWRFTTADRYTRVHEQDIRLIPGGIVLLQEMKHRNEGKEG